MYEVAGGEQARDFCHLTRGKVTAVTPKEGWLVGAAVVIPVAVLAALLIHVAADERRVRAITLLVAAVALGALGVARFTVVRSLIRS